MNVYEIRGFSKSVPTILFVITYLSSTHPEPVGGAFHMTCTSVLGKSSDSMTELVHSSSNLVSVSANNWNWPCLLGRRGAAGSSGSSFIWNLVNCCTTSWVRDPTSVTARRWLIEFFVRIYYIFVMFSQRSERETTNCCLFLFII